ncbi:autotransporter domain-containing protein [Bordetella sp. BOR01]|uniref:autotransporter domain-containing protein n=1 Tax=Bordetella sp. BOR01 TaxID=2854779 RepID=UPI001C4934F0|nr:autotransporter domain-containing protein [Bordetella sp. BOR01]MBV7482929.1 autotransporter domain-containing protein [Bordetella sp. BOR01]
MTRTVLTLALMAAFSQVPVAMADPGSNVVIDIPADGSGMDINGGTLTIVNGGVLTGSNAQISGAAVNLVTVEAGGIIEMDNVIATNNVDGPGISDSKTIYARGEDATAILGNAQIEISAHSTNPNVNFTGTAGVGALDGGTVTLNGGTVTASGSKRTSGLVAIDGGTINANGTEIVTKDGFGHAVRAFATTGLDKPATVNLDGAKIRTEGDSYSVGVQAVNKGATVTAVDTDIITEGQNSFGLEATNGAEISFAGGSITTSGNGAAAVRAYTDGSEGPGSITIDGAQLKTSGDLAFGVMAGDPGEPTAGKVVIQNSLIETTGSNSAGLAAGFGSTVSSTNTDIVTTGAGAMGAVAFEQGKIEINGGSISVGADHTYGLLSTGAGSEITGTNVAVSTAGLHGYGARAEDGGTITLTGGSISTNNEKGKGTQDGDGSRGYALAADGDGSKISTSDLLIATKGQRAYGAYATGGAEIGLEGGSVSTEGFMAYGLYASGDNSVVNAKGVDVTTSGNAGDGVWAYNGGTVNLEGGTVIVNGGPNGNEPGETANGLIAVGGIHEPLYDFHITASSPTGGTINAKDVTIITRGASSAGVKVGSVIGTDNTYGNINLEGSTVVVQGENARAAEVNYGSTLNAKGSTLVSEKGNGIVINDSGTVVLESTTVQAAKASLVSNLDNAGQEQTITVGAGSNLTQNNGTLLQVNRNDDGMDGVVNLTLGSGSTSRGDVIDRDGLDETGNRAGGGKTNFIVADGASWMGRQEGLSDITAGDGATIINEGGAPIAGNVTGGQNSTIAFLDGATIGGDFAVDTGSQAQFNGNTSIAGGVAANGSNVGFAGSAAIGGNLSGDASKFSFSQANGGAIGGDVSLSNGSSMLGGSIAAPIQIGGNVVVAGGSTLGGNLNVAGSLDASGGTLSPGNSVGTQTFGSISNLGTAYFAEVNAAGQSDLVIAQTGDVDLTGTALTVGQENGNGGFRINRDYAILQTQAGNVVGDFASAGLDSSFDSTLVGLDPVKVNAQDVKVSLSVDAAKVAAKKETLSSNQSNTLDGVVSVAGANTAADAALTSGNVEDSLNQLSGEIHASTQSALLYSGVQVREALSNRLRGGLTTQETFPLWAQVAGGEFTLDGDGNSAKARTTSGGLFIGGDTEIGQGWRLGAALGYTDSTTKVRDRASSKSDVNSYTAALYGGKSWERSNGQVDFLLGAAYTHHDIDTRRNVTVGGNQTLKADYNAKSAQIFTELGYGFNVGSNTQVGPFLGLAWLNLKSDSFNEKGGDAALHGDSRTDNTFTTTLGVRGKTFFEVRGTQAFVQGGLGWRHANGDIDPSRSMAFIAGDGASFSVAGAPIAKDAAAVNLGVGVSLGKNTTMGLSYNGQFGDSQTDNNGSLFLKVGF